MWEPDKWQENLLWHFIRTGDYWCGPAANPEMGGSPAKLMVGGMMEDEPKLKAIETILGGNVARARMEYFRNTPQRDYELNWHAQENTERYLRWFLDKWDNHRIIDAHNRRWRVVRALEAIDESHRNR